MRHFLISAVATIVLMTGCQNSPTGYQPPPVPAPVESEVEVEPPVASDLPRTLEINLTLREPEDLRVSAGQTVFAGQVLSDRVLERGRLENQLELLNISLQQVNLPIPAPPPPPQFVPMANLPESNFAQETAAVDSAQLAMQQAADATQLQREKLREISSVDGLPNSALMHEQAKLQQAVQREAIATAHYQLAISKRESARATRDYQEYLHNLEKQRRQIQQQEQQLFYSRAVAEYHQQIQQQEFRKSQLTIQITAAQTELAELTATTSPYAGQIRKIKHLGQTDHALLVAVILDVERTTGTNPTDRSQSGESAAASNANKFAAMYQPSTGMSESTNGTGNLCIVRNGHFTGTGETAFPADRKSERQRLDCLARYQPSGDRSERSWRWSSARHGPTPGSVRGRSYRLTAASSSTGLGLEQASPVIDNGARPVKSTAGATRISA